MPSFLSHSSIPLLWWVYDATVGVMLKMYFSLVRVIMCKHQFCNELWPGLRSRRFVGGVGFLTTLGVEVGFFCPTPHVQLDHFLSHTLNWEFVLKWYNFFQNFC